MRFSATAQRLVDRFGSPVTLTRSTPGTPDSATPWIPGTPTIATYALDAVAKGVTAEFIDGTTVVATDLMVVASPRAATSTGAVVEIVPRMSDALTIGGAAKVIKKIEAVPASGAAALFRIFVAS
jgi:hypothetical protein